MVSNKYTDTLYIIRIHFFIFSESEDFVRLYLSHHEMFPIIVFHAFYILISKMLRLWIYISFIVGVRCTYLPRHRQGGINRRFRHQWLWIRQLCIKHDQQNVLNKSISIWRIKHWQISICSVVLFTFNFIRCAFAKRYRFKIDSFCTLIGVRNF